MWEFSHSPEAYDILRENIDKQNREWLETTWAEIQARSSREEHVGGFNEQQFGESLAQAKKFADDVLSNAIFDFAMEQRLCDNGGHNAYCCPFFCHKAPMSTEDE